MGLDKAIAHGKEFRKPYYRAGRFDVTCRPRGGCPWCEGSRLIQSRRVRVKASDELAHDNPILPEFWEDEYYYDEDDYGP